MSGVLGFANRGTAWLLTWSWQAFLLLTVVWLMLKLSRAKLPVVRHNVWLSGLMAIAVLPLCSFVASRMPAHRLSAQPSVYWRELPLEVIAPPVPVSAINAVPEKISTAATDWHYLLRPLVFLAWLLGVGWVLLQFGLGLGATHRLRRSARMVSLEELDCDLIYPARVGLSAEAQSPMLIGVLRPMILLPTDILSWTNQDERRAMLQHEIAHLERRDHYVNTLQTLLSAVFFFHPVVRFACRQMRLERELACDDWVLNLGTKAETYAESILKVAERNILPRGLHQSAFFSTKQLLERRITMILSPDRPSMKHSRRYLLLPVSLLVVLIVLFAFGNTSGKSQSQAKMPDNKSAEQPQANPGPKALEAPATPNFVRIIDERGALQLLGLDINQLKWTQVIKLKHGGVIETRGTRSAQGDMVQYWVGEFEVGVNEKRMLYGVGLLCVRRKKYGFELSLSSDGAMYLDASHTQKVQLSELLK